MMESYIVYQDLCYVYDSRMGAGVMDYMELSHQAELHTGGLNAGTHISPDPSDLYGFNQV